MYTQVHTSEFLVCIQMYFPGFERKSGFSMISTTAFVHEAPGNISKTAARAGDCLSWPGTDRDLQNYVALKERHGQHFDVGWLDIAHNWFKFSQVTLEYRRNSQSVIGWSIYAVGRKGTITTSHLLLQDSRIDTSAEIYIITFNYPPLL